MSKPVLNKIHCKPVLRCITMYYVVSLYYFLLQGVSEPVLNKIYVCEPVLNKKHCDLDLLYYLGGIYGLALFWAYDSYDLC